MTPAELIVRMELVLLTELPDPEVAFVFDLATTLPKGPDHGRPTSDPARRPDPSDAR